MTELSDQQRHAIRRSLEDLFAELREEIRQVLLRYEDEQYLDLAGRVHDSEEQSVADLLVDLNLADIDRHVREMRELEAALLRIRQGTYGLCVDCDNPIAVGRLEAYPTAKRCLPCQEAYERDYRQEGHPSL